MSSLLVCGLCPLPFESTRQSYGPGIRTWQFARGLAQAGHAVHLLAMRIPGVYGDGEGAEVEERDGIWIERLPGPGDAGYQQVAARLAAAEAKGLDALVGATIYGSFALALTSSALPLWVDQFGHVMAEAQAKAALEGANWPLAHFWAMAERTGRRGDRFSTVSEPQRWACVGELGALSRLNAETVGEDLVSVIPCAVVPAASASHRPPRQGLRGSRLPSDAFIALWSGGYNVWSDTPTLLRGLELAMARCPRLHFVSTGAGIAGHDEASYGRFAAAVAASPWRERLHLLGWLPADDVPEQVASADLGVLSEQFLYEGRLGSKNRILQWLGAGLPVLCNQIGELGEVIARQRLGLTFEPGAAEQLADRLVWAAENPGELGELAARGRAHAATHWSFAATTRPLVAWAAAPCRAGDAPPGATMLVVPATGSAADRRVAADVATPVLSVVIPTRDRCLQLAATLTALATQDDAPAFEVIVVADGPQADVNELVASRRGLAWPPGRGLSLVEVAQLGPAAARNAGVARATAPRVLLLGDDTVPAPGTLRRHADSAHEGVAVQGRIDWHPQRGVTPVMEFLAPAGPQFYFVGLRPGEVIPPRAMLGSNLSAPTVWFRTAPFDERFRDAVFEDTELSMRWARLGRRAVYDPLALCWHDHAYGSIEPFLARQRRAGAAARLAVRLHPSLLGLVVLGPALIGLRSLSRLAYGPLLGRRGREDRWDLRCRLAFLRGFFGGAAVPPVLLDDPGRR